MLVTVRTALEMLQAVLQLDRYEVDNKQVLYKYDPATRLALAGIRRKLRAVQDDFFDARNQLLLQITDGAGELPALNGHYRDPDERRRVMAIHIAFNQRERELMAAKVEVDLPILPAAKLNLEENPIPPSVLDMLGDLVKLDG